MNWWQWTLTVLAGLTAVWKIYQFTIRRTTVSHVWSKIGVLMHGSALSPLVVTVLRYRHRYSDYALELYRGRVDDHIDDATVLGLSEAWCYPGDFERAATVLEKYGIDYRIVRPGDVGARFLLVPGGKDIRKMCRAAMYILMDGFHLPYTAKFYQNQRFMIAEGDGAHIKKMLALAYPSSQSESSQDAASSIPQVDAPDAAPPPAPTPETGPDRTGISAAESPAADPDSNQPRDPDDLIVIPRRLRGNGNPESPDTGQ
jgi:hypothetical protein